MSIVFNDIYNSLHEKYLDLAIYRNGKDNIIKDIRFITKECELYQSEILYIGKVSQINNCNSELNGNYILLDDENLWGNLNNSNYITVKNEEDIFSISNLIKDMLLKEVEIFNPAANLLNSLAQGKGLKYLLEIGSESIKNPIILIDAGFSILSYSSNFSIEDSIWIKNIERGYCSYEFIAEVNKLKTVKDSAFNNEPFQVNCSESTIDKYVSKVIIDSKLVGYLILLQSHNQISPKDIDIFKILNNAITEELKNDSAYRNIKGVKYENFIFDLLEGKIVDESIALERMKSAECNFSHNLYIITIDISNYTGVNSGSDINKAIGKYLNHSKSIYYKDHIVVLFDEGKSNTSIEDTVERFVPFLEEYNLTLGISEDFCKLTNMKEKYLQTKKTLLFSKKLKRKGNIFSYSEISFYDFLDGFQGDLGVYCHKSILNLLKFDEENGTDYYDTLQCYLTNNQSINQTAKQLFVHRNTLSYRITKIKELINVDLKDSETLFNISFTFKIIDYLRINHIV